MRNISKEAAIGKNLNIGVGCWVEKATKIGDNVVLGRNVSVRPGTIIHDNCIIEDNAIIGYQTLTRLYDTSKTFISTIIRGDTLIRPGCVLYKGTEIGESCVLNQHVVIREGTKIGNHTSIGCLAKSDGYLKIGNHCSIHSFCNLTPFMEIEDYVFMGPGTMCLNDAKIDFKRKEKSKKAGPKIGYGSRIGANSTLCPAVVIGRESFVSAGSLVTRDVPDFAKVRGVPARVIGSVSKTEAINDLS